MNKIEYINRVPISKNNICIQRDEDKCTNCGACKGICRSRIGVYGNYDMKKSREPICIYCGQCSLICPNNSIYEVEDYKKVRKAILNGRNVIFQISPAVRFLVGDEYGYPVGKNVIGKIVGSLRKLGVKYIFDTSYGADLTIVEEANELIDRINRNDKLPLFTSCCPAWVKYLDVFYPQYKKKLSTCKSPILMLGSVIKNYYAKKNGIDNPIVVALVPCTAKKYEITKTDDVDYAITVREFIKWLKEEKIDFRRIESSRFDYFTGTSSGVIFGTSGGVTESMIRYVYHKMTGRNTPKKFLNFVEVRGLNDVKEAIVKINDREISIAIINGTGDVSKVIEKMDSGEKHYDIIEVMACDGGCIAGGGGPKVNKINNINKIRRSESMYKLDRNSRFRNSYENKKIKKLYKNLFMEPNSIVAHKLLHIKENSDE